MNYKVDRSAFMRLISLSWLIGCFLGTLFIQYHAIPFSNIRSATEPDFAAAGFDSEDHYFEAVHTRHLNRKTNV